MNHVPFAVNESITIIPNISYSFTPVSWQRLAANGSWVNLAQTGANFTITRAAASDAGLYRFNFSIGSRNYILFYRLETDPNAPPYLGTPVTGVNLDRASITMMVGGTEPLTATVLPSNATNINVTWSSSDESIATVDAYGVVTAVSAGTALITVTTVDGGFVASCIVTVTAQPISVTGVSLNKPSATIIVGRTEPLTATVYPANATNRGVTWSSSNPSVATVDAYGVVTAVSAGTALITVTTVDGGFAASCTVTVGEAMLLSSITKTVSAYTTFNIVCSFTNITLSDNTTFGIGYDPTQVELVNFAAQTQELHITVGLVAGTSLEILYHNTATGELVFKVHSANPSGQPWSGVVTVLRFEAKVTGYITIYIEQLTD